ncbi:hypothetical protein JAAARDRAFT_211309 [Jaapia argillacea MUCL 33604]|uniref:DUF6699 domain-containing protein n=1 Tax=Jaapia argillacea MUCL 33604 TaxID=933084 RepID=A0A067PBG9_9AGAM|nr:hypothetical protein JAAARDRAFT_211309 [Jaapia argillacea MUCL 33604]
MDSYLSYLRNMFGSSNPSRGHGHSASHSRSRSSSSANYVYAAPPSAPLPGTARSDGSMKRSATYTSHSHSQRPSPLRYHTQEGAESRPTVHRRGSYQMAEPAFHYPAYAASSTSTYSTPASSRSNSFSSTYRAFPVSAPPVPASHKHVRYADERPALKQNHSWHPTSTASTAPSYAPVTVQTQATISQPRQPPLHMHPLLAYTRFHQAPISYDATYAPSARTVVDRTTRQPVPSVTLAQPATDPPTAASARLILTSDKLPWAVVVITSSTQASKSSSRSHPSSGAITNFDVLYALHATLSTRVTQAEWDALGHGSRAQRKITRAFEKRCERMGGGREGGVRRIDWLEGKTRLVGVEVDKSKGGAGIGRLVFEKP